MRKVTQSFILQLVTIGAMLAAGIANYYLLSDLWLVADTGSNFLFLIGYFSDLMWCTALYMFVVILSQKKFLGFWSQLSLLLLPFITEALQFLGILKGTADYFDLLLYAVIFGAFKICFHNRFIPSGSKSNLRFRLYPVAVLLFFLIGAIASTTSKQAYKPQPRPCITHAPITTSSILVRVYISGSYTMKDLSGAQISGRDLFVRALNKANPYKYKLADGVNPQISFNITINEYSGYYGADVYMDVSDNNCKSAGKYICCCQAYRKYETSYVTAEKLFDDIAVRFDGFVRGGWCTDCQSPCNPY
jgi:hypothetical protein